jgi:hypothetical protein
MIFTRTNSYFFCAISKAYKTSLITPPLFTEVSVPSQESEQSCIYVLGHRLDTMIKLVIDISLYNEESFRSSNKLVKFFNNCRVIFIRSSS